MCRYVQTYAKPRIISYKMQEAGAPDHRLDRSLCIFNHVLFLILIVVK